METQFREKIEQGYTFKGQYITLGGAVLGAEAQKGLFVNIPLKMLNRHGLIAGATGTGKTKTLQSLVENMSDKGIPTLLMDLKGDLSGLAREGEEKDFITERHNKIGLPYKTKRFPVEFLTISGEKGVRMRATVSEFGPVLLSRILDLSDVQEGVLSVVFKYCDSKGYLLLDLKDLKKVLQYSTNEGKDEFEAEYGRISSASTSTILRKIMELESQGADLFFGERSFEVEDLMETDKDGNGKINIIRLTDIQDKPKMFSTFMLCLLSEIYNTMDEQGDSEKPKLVVFIDEAHLIFKQASKALLDQLEVIVKLIRSKGVGLIFCTQTPTDVPDVILSQLGLKIQHALRAFTAKDRQSIKQTAQNYPVSQFYDVAEQITALGTGEAFVTALDEKGRPTPLVYTMVRTPMSRMDVLSDGEINEIVESSKLVKKYNQDIDRESAYEILNDKISRMGEDKRQEKERDERKGNERKSYGREKTSAGMKVLTSATFIRGAFGVLTKVINMMAKK